MKWKPELEIYRVRNGVMGSRHFEGGGLFIIPGPYKRELRVIASSGDAELGILWEHVSVSTVGRCPNWPEMDLIKRLFWDDEETVMQLHPPRSQWINQHPFCLHLWKPIGQEIPLPPPETVGEKIEGSSKSESEKAGG